MAQIRKGTSKKGVYTTAEPDLLPTGWQFDDWYKEEIVYPKIRALLREGYSCNEVAAKVGCSDRTVKRVSGKMAA